MKKTALSIVALMALSGTANATSSNELATLKAQMNLMAQKIQALEAAKSDAGAAVTEDDLAALETKMTKITNDAKKNTSITSKSPKIEFSGTHYLGFTTTDDNLGTTDTRTNKFETRRNYFQAKAYFKENPKDYLRITLDTFQNEDKATGINGSTSVNKAADDGSWLVRLKYAYLYMDEILPYTGVELGQVHRPWIDYEEHNSWLYRSVSKVFIEDKGHGVDFTNSADLGFNLKTKTPYFSSELGLFNGEGYHSKEDGKGMSAEWRLTGHLLGTGEEKVKSDLQYANVSFFGQRMNDDAKTRGDAVSKDFNWYGFHAVYNQPEFLLAGQYIKTQDAKVTLEGKGYSINGEARITPEISLIGLYNVYNFDSKVATDVKDQKGWLAGAVYKYNKNVSFIANYLAEDKTKNDGTKSLDSDSVMVTAEVKW